MADAKINDPSKVAYCKGAWSDEAQFLILGLGSRQNSKNTLFLTFLTLKNYFRVCPVLWQNFFGVKSWSLAFIKKATINATFCNDKQSKNWFFQIFITLKNYFRVLPVLWPKFFQSKVAYGYKLGIALKKVTINATFSTINGPKTDFFPIFWL